MTDKSALSNMKFAVVDDHDLVREGLKVILVDNGVKDIEKFHTAKGLVSSIDAGLQYDFFILDLELPDMDGFELIDEIRERNPEARIIVSTIHDEIWTLRKLLARDVNAIIYKTGDSGEFITAIKEILDGNSYYCREVHKSMKLADDKSFHPSSRELEVLGLIARGKTTREIADTMFVSDNTVESHRKSLFYKLGAVNVADLIMKAISRGYINS